MPRLGLGLGLNLPRPIFLGGGIPSEPTGFVAKYTAYLVDNFTLVTGDSINVWQDESVNSNDLTQGTSANQPKLVEDNTVTQFTASNQPTFAKDKQVTQETASNQPTYDATEGALAFGNNDFFNNFNVSGDFTLEFELSKEVGNWYLSRTATPYILFATNLLIRSDTSSTFTFVYDSTVKTVCKIVKDGNSLSVYRNGLLVETKDVTGNTFTFDRLGYTSQSTNGLLLYLKQWDSAVSTGTPDFELDGSDPSTMLNDSDAQPVNGDSVRLWHDPSAVDVMAFDGVDDNLTYVKDFGSSDFTFEIDYDMGSVTSGVKIFLGGGSNIRIDSSTLFRLKSNESSFYSFNA